MYDLGVIGVGNMAGAILRGALKAGTFEPSKVIAHNRTVNKIADLAEDGVRVAENENEVALQSKILLLGVKPYMMATLGEKIRNDIPKDTLVVSIAGGVSLHDLMECFGEDRKIIRVMPNTPALVNEGMTAIAPGPNVHMDELKKVFELFEAVGKVALLEEEKIDPFSGAVGCMPAFVFMFIEAAADAAVKNGLTRREAYDFVAQAVLGSAKMVMETKLHPGELKDQVTSPKGSTIRGVMALEREGLRNAVIAAVDEATLASKKLN